MVDSILRIADVLARRGKRRSSHYSDVKRGLFPRPVRIGERQAGWPASEVDAVNAAQIAETPDNEIRQLVAKLEAARKGKREPR